MKSVLRCLALVTLVALTLTPPAHAGWYAVGPIVGVGTYQPPNSNEQIWGYPSQTEYLNTVTNATKQASTSGNVQNIYYEWDGQGTTPIVGQIEYLTYVLQVGANGYVPGTEENGGQNQSITWDYSFGTVNGSNSTTFSGGFDAEEVCTAAGNVQYISSSNEYYVVFQTETWGIQSLDFPTGLGSQADGVLISWTYSSTGVSP